MTGDSDFLSDAMAESLTTRGCPLAMKTEPPLHIRISVFIDGTLNNWWNTTFRKYRDESPLFRNDSYFNDYSNIPRLAETAKPCADEDYHVFRYVPGMGTTSGGEDDLWGSALGRGRTGIVERAEGCFEQIVQIVRDASVGRQRVRRLRVDCFGFSRGAATARHLVHLMVVGAGLVGRIQEFNIDVDNFEIPFVGLFDTVAHCGTNFENDTEELGLDAIKDERVAAVVQLAAGDEHRHNFPLTNIRSAGSKGLEIFLPGAHADVGGSYNDKERESNRVLYVLTGPADHGPFWERCHAIRRELINLGWFQEDEITCECHLLWPGLYRYSVIANRGAITNIYSYVPLHIMAEKAGTNGKGLSFHLCEYNFSKEPQLVRIRQVIENNTGNDLYWLYNRDSHIQSLRRFFLHFSAHYDSQTLPVYQPQFYDENGATEYDRYADNELVHRAGYRRRRIFNG